ncbi:MAG TPA: hypothetical protein VEK38_00905 [Candidatus Bathyarchaeia archaeon]|nr:hypothetical protein [Candidatus Bathyarchaeia archaeon]
MTRSFRKLSLLVLFFIINTIFSGKQFQPYGVQCVQNGIEAIKNAYSADEAHAAFLLIIEGIDFGASPDFVVGDIEGNTLLLFLIKEAGKRFKESRPPYTTLENDYADYNATNHNMREAGLFFSAIARELVAEGHSNVNIPNKEIKGPLVACLELYFDIAHLPLEIRNPLITGGIHPLVQAIVNAGADTTTPGFNGKTPCQLMQDAYIDDPVVEALICP